MPGVATRRRRGTRSRRTITYHGRSGHPMIHRTGTGRPFIMVRNEGGGVKRLYQGSKYRVNRQTKGTKDQFTRLNLK